MVLLLHHLLAMQLRLETPRQSLDVLAVPLPHLAHVNRLVVRHAAIAVVRAVSVLVQNVANHDEGRSADDGKERDDGVGDVAALRALSGSGGHGAVGKDQKKGGVVGCMVVPGLSSDSVTVVDE